jgi:hypothetical protein
MRNWINLITEAIERVNVRGIDVPVLTNPTRSVLRQFLETQGELRACVHDNGDLTVFPSRLATHGDIDDDHTHYPMMIPDATTALYRFDSGFPLDDVEAFQETLKSQLPSHRGLVRALGSGFKIEFDTGSIDWEAEGY